MKLKIVFIHPDLGIGGAERLVLDIATVLNKTGNKITFITNHCDKKHAFEEIKNDTFPVQVIGDWLPRSLFGTCLAFCSYIRMLYLSLVYVLFLKPNADLYIIDQIPVAIPLLKWAGKKVIYYCHHPDLLASPPGGKIKKLYRLPIDYIEAKGTEKSDVILVNSEYTAKVFRNTFPKINKQLTVLYPTISLLHAEIITTIKPTTINNNKIIFLSINRFHPAKNLNLAIEAMKILEHLLTPNLWIKTTLILAGGYDPQSDTNSKCYVELQHLVHKKNLDDKVCFIKSPSDIEKVQLLVDCNCLIYTPIKEHFGIVPLEAMSVGKPVIACNSGGPKETIENNITGYLCEADADSMATSMFKIVNNKEYAEQMGRNGKQRLEKLFSQRAFAKQINKTVADVLCIKTKEQ